MGGECREPPPPSPSSTGTTLLRVAHPLPSPRASQAESNAWAANFTYTAPEAPTPLPAQYQQQALQICWRQIALGGYRLAATLNGALGQGADSLVRVAAALRGAARHAREQRYDAEAGEY